ncbi:MAG TPA: septum formation protein Maf [Clostridiales bacterium]|nr:septum formation protein Maf [Clostridiales bacterium]
MEVSGFKFILASASPRRARILEQLGMKFEVIAAEVDEVLPPGVPPGEAVMQLAMAKAGDVGKRIGSGFPAVIIGADTVVAHGGRIMGKPASRQEALDMLTRLQGSWHQVFTGVGIVGYTPEGSRFEGSCHEMTRVRMAHLREEQIRAYIRTGEPMDKAGAYGIQERGAMLVERIEGCFFNVMGLPVYRFARLMADLGLPLLGK